MLKPFAKKLMTKQLFYGVAGVPVRKAAAPPLTGVRIGELLGLAPAGMRGPYRRAKRLEHTSPGLDLGTLGREDEW
jgi:hypothetical protein